MNLYSRRPLQASLALLLITTAGLALAQTQKRKAHRLRATALVELTTDRAGNVKARLTPITILTEGRFEDASIYKAAPEPMALDNGIVYEAQKSGVPVGYVTITNSSKGSIWTALGKWQAVSTVAKETEPAPAPPNPNDGRPHLKRPGEGSTSSSTPTPSPTPDSSASPPAGSSSDDRPRLHRPDERPAEDTTPSPTAAPSATQESPQSAPEPAPEDSDRPVLRRRSPSTAAAVPTPAPAVTQAPGARPTPVPQGVVPATLPKPPAAGTQTLVAVSDNQPTETRSFTFIWKPGEQEIMEAKMRKLALAQLPQENSQLNDGSLRNVVIRSFDLDLSNDAVMVLTAEIPGSYLAQGRKTQPGKFVSRYITLIARVDFEGVPRRLAVSVTDSSRLDVAPRLELIDAVDLDGDGLGELLFREYSFDQKSFIIYGIGRSTVTKVFEGASQDLK
jgi:hypothetical protein